MLASRRDLGHHIFLCRQPLNLVVRGGSPSQNGQLPQLFMVMAIVACSGQPHDRQAALQSPARSKHARQIDKEDRPAIDAQVVRVTEVLIGQLSQVGTEIGVGSEIVCAVHRFVKDGDLEILEVGVGEDMAAQRDVLARIGPPPACDPEVDTRLPAPGSKDRGPA